MIDAERQADLDDMLASCRAPAAKRMFREAVACYRAGAFRSCIVACWTAVVFDYLAKLGDLQHAGNGAAKQILQDFENARASSDVGLSLKLEGLVLDDAASKFELLSPIEKADLERLRLDRHRCAHPSLMSMEEPYHPSAELARVHMRNAAQHLLSRPPVQGREAMARIQAAIASDYFPEETEKAVEHLRPWLGRARATLVRSLIVDLTKQLFDPSVAGKKRLCAAMLAVGQLQHEEYERVLREKLPSLCRELPDGSLRWLVSYCRHVPEAFGYLGPVAEDRIRSYVESANEADVIGFALESPTLHALVLPRLKSLGSLILQSAIVKTRDSRPILDEVVRRFEESDAYSAFKGPRGIVEDADLAPLWSPEHKRRLVSALSSNKTLRNYMGFLSTVEEILELTASTPKDFKVEWRAAYEVVLAEAEYRSPAVAAKIRERFPDFPEPKKQ